MNGYAQLDFERMATKVQPECLLLPPEFLVLATQARYLALKITLFTGTQTQYAPVSTHSLRSELVDYLKIRGDVNKKTRQWQGLERSVEGRRRARQGGPAGPTAELWGVVTVL